MRLTCGRYRRPRLSWRNGSGHGSNIDYHVEFDGHYYSVPQALVRQEVEVRVTLSR